MSRCSCCPSLLSPACSPAGAAEEAVDGVRCRRVDRPPRRGGRVGPGGSAATWPACWKTTPEIKNRSALVIVRVHEAAVIYSIKRERYKIYRKRTDRRTVLSRIRAQNRERTGIAEAKVLIVLVLDRTRKLGLS